MSQSKSTIFCQNNLLLLYGLSLFVQIQHDPLTTSSSFMEKYVHWHKHNFLSKLQPCNTLIFSKMHPLINILNWEKEARSLSELF